MLAGLAQSPNRYNPYRNPERALERRAYVLRQMYEKAFIEEGEYRAADSAPLELVDPELRNPYIGRFGYYTDAVRREMLTRFDADDIFGGGLRVYTALDIAAQTEAQRALRAGLREYDGRHGWLRPLEVLTGDGAAARYRAANHRDILETGLLPDREYRAVVLRSDDDATVLGIGPAEVLLDRSSAARMRADETVLWDTVFVPGTVYTVITPAAVDAALLADADPNNVRVSLQPAAEGAAVVLDPTNRHVLALVGGYDFATSAFNRAVQARRQVGSTFKPFVYAAAVAARVATPATIYADQPVTFPMPAGRTWSPQNYDGQYEGPMSLRTALARSRNVIAVRVLDQVGVGPVANLARNVGLDGEIPDNLTLALGSLETTPLELANAFASFPAQCNYREPILITRVDNATGDSLFVADDVVAPILDPATCYIAHSMMRSVVEGGTAARARSLNRELAGKTGTTNAARDAWFVGYSADLLTAVWIGRDDNETLGRRESGGSTALPVFIDLMGALLESREPQSFADMPVGVSTVRIDAATGLRARPNQEDARDEYFLPGTEPRDIAPSATDRSVTDILQNLGAPTTEEARDDGVFDGF